MTFKRNNLSQDVIHALTLTLVLCLTLLSGCSDKEEILPPEPEEGTDIVSEYKAYVGHPFNASLGEQTNGYTIKNNDPEKLKTEYFGIEHFGVVCIFPLCEGESSIHVLDKNNKLVKIIKIQTTMWGSKDVEVENRNGTRYTFDNQTRLFTMTFPDGRKGYEGTYKCRVDSLIMQTQSIIKKYGYEVSYKNKFLIIREDRTEEFCQRYPDSGVTSVTTQEIWRDYSILDIFP